MRDGSNVESSERLLLTTRQAAEALAVSTRTLWTLTDSGQLPAVRIGRRVLYHVSDLVAFIERHKEEGGAQ